MRMIHLRSGFVNVGYSQRSTALCGGSIFRRSAKTPKVSPHKRRGRPTVRSVCDTNGPGIAKRCIRGLGNASGMKPSIELQYRLSDGMSLMAENIIMPSIDRSMRRRGRPPCFANRSDRSTYSKSREPGERRARSGTQCVDATSVGCNLRGGLQ